MVRTFLLSLLGFARGREVVVTDPAVIARLPHAGPLVIHWHWGLWWKSLFADIRAGKAWRYWSVHCYYRMRFANSASVTIGPLVATWPMPWLLASAIALHPEAFQGV